MKHTPCALQWSAFVCDIILICAIDIIVNLLQFHSLAQRHSLIDYKFLWGIATNLTKSHSTTLSSECFFHTKVTVLDNLITHLQIAQVVGI
ncbi:hypothetical protein TNCT_708431 [Trichonephila clavata]|uniref:Uncharacterized protein n=1 Tax=Trichonephila clavata TaxID=2740835 RepID=A0A8X6K5W4_TRICU|nr:hypothetical protein TNCT_708431 [Trichonephila clavata]